MRNYWIAAGALLASIFATPAFAQGNDNHVMPAVDHPWSSDEFRTANAIIASFAPDDLPRATPGDPASVFSRITDLQIFAACSDPDTPPADRADACMPLLEDTVALFTLYFNVLADDLSYAEEIVALSEFTVELAIVMHQMATEALPLMDRSEPGYADRMAGYDEMNAGFSKMTEGAVMMLEAGPNVDAASGIPITDGARTGLARAVAHAFTIFDFPEPKRSTLARKLKKIATSDSSAAVRAELAMFAT